MKQLPIEHGEIWLQPVKKMPKGKKSQHNMFIVGHSETGHHHVLEASTEFDVIEGLHDVYIELKTEGKLVHKKQVEKHNTLTVTPGKHKDADLAQANAWGIPREDYLLAKQRG